MKNKVKVLAISSGGGHWVQLLRLRPAFEDCEVIYASVRPEFKSDLEENDSFELIPDATRWDRVRLVWMILYVTFLLVKLRPDVVISTGAAPGFVAIRIARLIGARTIWLDSIANSEVVSLSGQKIGKYADLWLTQWQHLERSEGPFYIGSVI